jgi:uncharacterized protein
MIFVDSSAFLARYLERDQHHVAARQPWAELLESKTMLVTSCHVIVETLTLLGRRTNYRFAAERARNLYASTHITILRADEQSEIDAVSWFERMAAHQVSFADCISFSLMKRLGIGEAFAFDNHFSLAGFTVIPNR